MKRMIAWLALAGGLVLSVPAGAAEHVVHMLSRSEDGRSMVFEPSFLKIAVGDTVRFVPTQPSHNAESIEGMLPEGAEPFAGKINEEIDVTFTVEGIYGYKCKPHYAMGMVGLIQVGENLTNLDSAKAVKVVGRGKKFIDETLASLGQ